jgi:hypothetical protein
MTPEVTIALAKAIAGEPDPYRRTLAAARTAFDWLGLAVSEGRLELPQREQNWLDRLRGAFDQVPDSAEALRSNAHGRYGELFDSASYDLEV